MAEVSGIEWTDATVNFWWGCKKVGPGCDHCYAETWAQRFGIPDYDASGVRRKIKGAVALIRKLQRQADKFEAEHGRRRRVFIQSMSDFFDKDVDPAWREEAWEEIMAADRLDIQLVTKRIPNVQKMIRDRWPAHVGLIVTVVNQEEANRDIPRLLFLKAARGIPWVGLSIEPMLGGINLAKLEIATPKGYTDDENWAMDARTGRFAPIIMLGGGAWELDGGDNRTASLDWVICGGESGTEARPVEVRWVWDLRDQCAETGTPFFFKQWGAWHADAMAYTDGQGRNPPPNMKIGVKRSGRTVAGRTHDEFPRIAHAR